MSSDQENLYRLLPSIDALLRGKVAVCSRDEIGPQRLARLAREITEQLRQELNGNGIAKTVGELNANILFERAERLLSKRVDTDRRRRLRRVINASGVILHTNLGRAPLSSEAILAAAASGSNYSNLEYDTESGERGRRAGEVEELLTDITGSESALVVNNCAAATLLVLSVLGGGGEAIISRGELVEIGGEFRVPDVMSMSNTRLVEVGTTNRTRISDYSAAINENTRLITRVHPSNYRIIGFTAAPNRADLIRLAHDSGLPYFEDAGSGAILDMTDHGIADEPLIPELIAAGADVVTFSGDKLLGGPQAGIIVGKDRYLSRFRANPLFRALRAGKLVLSALQATLASYRRGTAFTDIPVLRALAMPPGEIEERTKSLIETIKLSGSGLECVARPGFSVVGGGSAPATELPTCQLELAHPLFSAEKISNLLRHSDPPVIARIVDGKVCLDLRTVNPADEAPLTAALVAIGR